MSFKAIDCGIPLYNSQLQKLAKNELSLKVGAQVVLTKSIRPKDGLVNGTRGTVTKFSGNITSLPVVKFTNGLEVVVGRESWGITVNGTEVAKRLQLPLDLSWALSIHKSQGMSLDKVIIDITKVFECGQTYVALSRARTLEGLCIKGNHKHDLSKLIRSHPKVREFYERMSSS